MEIRKRRRCIWQRLRKWVPEKGGAIGRNASWKKKPKGANGKIFGSDAGREANTGSSTQRNLDGTPGKRKWLRTEKELGRGSRPR